MEEIRPNTIFCDIDGTLVKQNTAAVNAHPDLPLIVLFYNVYLADESPWFHRIRW